MLSTFHTDEPVDFTRRSRRAGGTETIKKPRMVKEYNQSMNGVDINDQSIKYYGFPHRYVFMFL
jgi:hypothetical protein